MTFKVSKQDKSSSRLAIDDLSHKKVILYILLLTLFILPTFSLNYDPYINFKPYISSCRFNNGYTSNDSNCKELFDNDFTTSGDVVFSDSGSCYPNLTVYLNTTFYSSKNANISLDKNTQTTNALDPNWLKLFINNVQVGFWYDLVNATTSGSGASPMRHDEYFNLTSYDNSFNSISFRFKCPSQDVVAGNTFRVYELGLGISLINASNQLPSFNVSFNSTCSANGQTNITPIIYSNDPEGDTLYYATDFSQVANVSEEVIYDSGGVLLNSPLYNFLLNTYNDGLYCYFNRESLSTPVNYSKFNLAEYALNPSLFNSFGNKYMARLNSNCNGKPEFIYRFDRPFGYMEYFTTIYDLIDTGEYFNVTMYDVNFDPIVKFRYEVLNNKVLIKYYNHTSTDKHGHNVTQLLQLGNYTITNQTQKVEFLYYNVPNESFSRLYDYHKNTIYQINNLLEDKTINYVGISVGDYEIYQDGFRYAGSVPSLEFSTTPFESFNIRDTERYVLNYYMSDSIHQPDEYTYQRYIVNVPECGVVNGGWEDLENYDDLASAGDILRLLYNFIGKPIRNYNSVLDPDGLGETVFIWWVYLGLFIMFSVTMFNFTRTFSITAPLILSSLLIAGYSLLSGYIVSLIVSLMLLAFSVAGPIVGGMNNGGK